MSMSKYELMMLEEKRKAREFEEQKKKVSRIIAIIFFIFIIGILLFFVGTEFKEKMNQVDSSLEKETPKSKG